MDTCPDCSKIRRTAQEAVIDIIEGCESAFEQLGGAEQAVWDGIRILRDRALRTAKRLGMEPVGEVGEHFDPELHDAIDTTPAPTPDLVESISRRGWRDTDTGVVLHHAQVVVGVQAQKQPRFGRMPR